jgi:nitroimidazol reductase NimA-like FMN-containing flavoprotein (pyridoxamine 5'-phosphate oxidase superfamily)
MSDLDQGRQPSILEGFTQGEEHDPDAIQPIPDEECWDLLGRNQFGHIAYHLAGEIGINPVNYVSDGSRLLFRTAEGTKLFALTVDDRVAFEVDEIGVNHAMSVIVHGHVHKVPASQEHLADALELHPWVPTKKYNVMEIIADTVTGRSFRLDR